MPPTCTLLTRSAAVAAPPAIAAAPALTRPNSARREIWEPRIAHLPRSVELPADPNSDKDQGKELRIPRSRCFQ
ncbi:hypothetical protein GCM10027360_61260 [Amycolatopsis echigonensis]